MPSQPSEQERLRALWDDESVQLCEQEWLAILRQLLIFEPDDAGLWSALAFKLGYLLTDISEQGGLALRSDPMFWEMISAFERASELSPDDVAGPYNRAAAFKEAGLLEEAYPLYLQAGRLEVAHPGDIEWPAAWHFRHAAEVALELGRPDDARAALQEAVDLCGADDPDVLEVLGEFGAKAGYPGPHRTSAST